ncbi:sensor histidine kinase [Streptomyces sp. NPDC004726]
MLSKNVSAPRAIAPTAAAVIIVTAGIDLGELIWGGVTTGWLLVTAVTTVVSSVSMLWRRTRPGAALTVACLGYAVAWVICLSQPRPLPAMVQAAVWVTAFGAVATGTERWRHTALAALGMCVAADAYAHIAVGWRLSFAPAGVVYTIVNFSFIPVVVVAAADAVRGRVALATARAEQADRLRELDARGAAHDERLRLARELHDVVANRLSAVAMRITAVGHVNGTRRTPEGRALTEIGSEIDSALTELRSVLGTLRDDEHGADTPDTHSLNQLPGLAESARRAGAEVEVTISGEPRPLPSLIDLAAYRIIQEALANVTRHACPPRATVTLDYRDTALHLRVDDDGAAPGGPSTEVRGHGIIGIRERAALCGGRATAGPRPGGGWRVDAVLPCRKGVS